MNFTQTLFVFVLGLEFGSFANVCIYRWPRNRSILSPLRSQCPKCRRQLTWYENVPLLSFVFLRGKCASCQSAIPWRYPIVELLLPLLWLGTVYMLDVFAVAIPWPFWIAIFSFIFVLLVTTFTDFDFQLIPDPATFLLTVTGVFFAYWNPFFSHGPFPKAIMDSIVGGVVGGGVLWTIAVLGKRLFKKDAMGGGDIKLMAGFGTLLGWEGVLLTLFLGSLAGGLFAIFGLLTRALKRHQYIPFGPFLNLGALATFAWMCHQISTGQPHSLSALFSF